VISGFLQRLLQLPQVMRSWPGRFKRWSIRKFWEFIAWLRALPRRIKEAIIAFCIALKEGTIALFFALVNAITNGYARLCGALERATAPLRAFVHKQLDQDPAKIPASRLALSDRGRKIANFSRQLASMTQGGVGLLQSLDVLAEQSDDPRLSYVCSDLAGKLGQGFSFSKATSEYPRIFPPVYFHLLRAGESTGRLIEVINQLADLLEREEQLIKRVKSALSYPVFVMVLTFFLTLGLFSTVLPGFADFYADFKVPLPVITDVLMRMTRLVQTWWFWVLLMLLLGGIYELVRRSWQILEYRALIFSGLLSLPLMGPIIRYTCLARLCWVMALTQEAGLDVFRSVKLACLASGNPLLEIDSRRLTHGITAGEQLSDLMLHRPDLYPHLLQQMVMMGEETSRNSEAYGRAASWFEQDVEGRIENFQAALEPILMGLISTVVGTIVMAVFMPLYGLLDKLGV
jgi:type II secretory pathway component PulF